MAAAYSASKAAVIAMTKAIGKDLAGTGVLVNCDRPGRDRDAAAGRHDRGAHRYMVERIPMGRLGSWRRSRRWSAGSRARSARSRPARPSTSPAAGRSIERALSRHRRARLPRRLGGEGGARRRRRAGRLRPRRRDAPAGVILAAGGARAADARARRHHRPRGLPRARRARDHARRPSRRAAGAVLPRGPRARRAVNVVGTVNVFEAVKQRRERIAGVAYASSAAFYGPDDVARALERRDRARHALRRLQAGERGQRAALPGGWASRPSGSGPSSSTGAAATRA